MVKKSLTLENLKEIARFLHEMSDENLERKGFLLVYQTFPFVNDLSHATDVASLVKYERLRRKKLKVS